MSFYLTCNDAKVVPLPIFTKIQEGRLHIAGQYISHGMGKALANLLVMSPAQLTEIHLDDNGLKDESFAAILSGVENKGNLKVINYSNNGIGPLSVEALRKILARRQPDQVTELRISNVKASK